jgi:CheY-like chemotaxis protein
MLVIEDAPDIREVFTALLRAEGATVVAVGTGGEAAELCRTRPFDVILSDLGLPDIPGDVLIRQILTAGRSRACVIVITGYGEPFISRARQAGADVVFTKPVEWTRVLDFLHERRLPASA